MFGFLESAYGFERVGPEKVGRECYVTYRRGAAITVSYELGSLPLVMIAFKRTGVQGTRLDQLSLNRLAG